MIQLQKLNCNFVVVTWYGITKAKDRCGGIIQNYLMEIGSKLFKVGQVKTVLEILENTSKIKAV